MPLDTLRSQRLPGNRPPPRRTSPVRVGARVLATAAIVILLPFAVLLKVSVYLYVERAVPTWLALAGGAMLAVGVLTAYGAWLSIRVSGKARLRVVAQWVALPLVAVYCGHSLLTLSRVNAKTDRVREYYTSLHPLLRLGVSTWILLDDDLVVTDLGRTPADYVAMGLPVLEQSFHYRQVDGYVHAMDLRTADRGAARNWLTQAYFRLLGFRTLRHVGTADHLHVSLPMRGRGKPGIRVPADLGLSGSEAPLQ